nr:hypothetical protein [Tanacetum cinerariifolium]
RRHLAPANPPAAAVGHSHSDNISTSIYITPPPRFHTTTTDTSPPLLPHHQPPPSQPLPPQSAHHATITFVSTISNPSQHHLHFATIFAALPSRLPLHPASIITTFATPPAISSQHHHLSATTPPVDPSPSSF